MTKKKEYITIEDYFENKGITEDIEISELHNLIDELHVLIDGLIEHSNHLDELTNKIMNREIKPIDSDWIESLFE